MPEYRIGRLNGRLCLTWWRDGKRHRYSLGTSDPREAERLAPALYAELTRPKGTTIGELWRAYVRDKEGRAVTITMGYTFKSLRNRFGPMEAHAITVADCRAHTDARLRDGIRPGTIHTELGHLRMVLRWAEKHGLIDRAPHIERPPKPRPKERHLTREQVRSLFDNAHLPHIRLYGILAYTTAARNAALLGLTWDRCDFEAGRIDLRDITLSSPHGGAETVGLRP